MQCTVDGFPVGENQLEIYPADAFQLEYTLLRQITMSNATGGHPTPTLGPIYWAGSVPCGMHNASFYTGVSPITLASATTQSDVQMLRSQNVDAQEYTTQSCRNGPCQDCQSH